MVAVWLALAFIWLIVLLSATVAGECTYEEVRCSSAGEILSDYGGFGFLVIVPLAIVFAWWWSPVRPRSDSSLCVRRTAARTRLAHPAERGRAGGWRAA